jgi:hypothetical protein
MIKYAVGIVTLILAVLLLSQGHKNNHFSKTVLTAPDTLHIESSKQSLAMRGSNGRENLSSNPHFSKSYGEFATMDQHTTLIGTSSAPTLDGGIINSADGMVHPPHLSAQPAFAKPQRPTSSTSIYTSLPTPFVSAGAAKQAAFDDHWANTKALNHVLTQAAQQGQLSFVLQEALRKNLPASVALVPVVESAYQAHAVSDKGAAGAWQIMPETAKALNLPISQRFNFTASTSAALTLLQQLHVQFGSWDLAYAAYNAGSGRVMHALKNNPGARSIDDLNLPLETKNYVHSLQKMSEMISANA